jgi:hypothetical protein
MDVRTEDICIVKGFRLTEYQVYSGDNIAYTYFNIRNDKGAILGRNYDDIEIPLDIITSMMANKDASLNSD